MLRRWMLRQIIRDLQRQGVADDDKRLKKLLARLEKLKEAEDAKTRLAH